MVNLRLNLPLSLDRRKIKKDGTEQRTQNQPIKIPPSCPVPRSHTVPPSPRRRYNIKTPPPAVPLRVTVGPTLLQSNLTPKRQVAKPIVGVVGLEVSINPVAVTDKGCSAQSVSAVPSPPHGRTGLNACTPPSTSSFSSNNAIGRKPAPRPLDLPKLNSLRISIPSPTLSFRSTRSPRTPGSAFSTTHSRSPLSGRFDPTRTTTGSAEVGRKPSSPVKSPTSYPGPKQLPRKADSIVTDMPSIVRHRPQPLILHSPNIVPARPLLNARATCATPICVPSTPLTAKHATSSPRTWGSPQSTGIASVGTGKEQGIGMGGDEELEWEIVDRVGALTFV